MADPDDELLSVIPLWIQVGGGLVIINLVISGYLAPTIPPIGLSLDTKDIRILQSAVTSLDLSGYAVPTLPRSSQGGHGVLCGCPVS